MTVVPTQESEIHVLFGTKKMNARMPIFFKSSDGAIDAQAEAVRSCSLDFQKLAGKIAAYLRLYQIGEI